MISQLVGWFTFGTFLILKGAFLNSVYEQKQSGGSYGYGRTFSRSLTEELAGENGPQEIYFKLPYIEEWTVSRVQQRQRYCLKPNLIAPSQLIIHDS